MDDLFLLLFLVSAITLLVGLVKPGIVIRWGDETKRTRGKVIKTYGVLMIGFFIAFGMLVDSTTIEESASKEPSILSDELGDVENTSTESVSEAPESEEKPSQLSSEDPYEPKTFEEEIEFAIGEDIQVNAIELDEYAKDLYITVEMSDNITTNLTRLGIEKAAAHIFENVFPLLENREDIEMITFVSETTFVDVYGNESIDDASIISMTKETYNKINWENFLTENLKNIATSYYLHPTFNK